MAPLADYYDVHSVLAEDEKAQVHFNTDVYQLGFLDNGAGRRDIAQGSKVELPIWLGLALGAGNFVDLQLPMMFQGRFLLSLLADPPVMNLRDKSPYYYEVGAQLSHFLRSRGEGGRPLIHDLVTAFSTRYGDILDKSQNSRGEDTTKVTKKLTQLERELFKSGYDAANELHRWKRRQGEFIVSAHPTKRRRY